MNKLLLAALLSLPVAASADVVVRSETTSTGFRGMGGSETKTTREVSGLKAREDSNTRFTGAVLGRLGGKKGRDASRILRVDLDKAWELDAKKKSYRETAITLPPLAEGGDGETGGGKPEREAEPTHRIKSAKASVVKTGEKKDVNGFAAALHKASLVVEVEELKTKKVSEYRLDGDIWTTPWTKELRRAADEEAAFQKAYLKKLGVELGPQDRARFGLEGARLLLASAGPEVEKAVSKLAREASKIDGFAVLTESSWRSPQAEAPAAPRADDDEGSALSDASGSSSVGGAALGVLGGFAKRAAKKKAVAAATPKAGAPLFSARTEILSVEVAGLSAERFDVPAGFKKKD